jgi:hypothetical protein
MAADEKREVRRIVKRLYRHVAAKCIVSLHHLK